MSYGFRVYFVSIEQVAKVYGSNDRELEVAVVKAEGWDEDEFTDPPVVGEETVRWRRALRGIFSGDVISRRFAAPRAHHGRDRSVVARCDAGGSPDLPRARRRAAVERQ